MLAQAERRRSLLPAKQQSAFELRQGDMRDFDLGRTFPLIACPFNAFQHLYTREDVERCLACVVKHLEPEGRFIVDVLLPDVEFLNRPPLRWFASTRFKHPTHNAWYGYAERSAWDPVLGRLGVAEYCYWLRPPVQQWHYPHRPRPRFFRVICHSLESLILS